MKSNFGKFMRGILWHILFRFFEWKTASCLYMCVYFHASNIENVLAFYFLISPLKKYWNDSWTLDIFQKSIGQISETFCNWYFYYYILVFILGFHIAHVWLLIPIKYLAHNKYTHTVWSFLGYVNLPIFSFQKM